MCLAYRADAIRRTTLSKPSIRSSHLVIQDLCIPSTIRYLPNIPVSY